MDNLKPHRIWNKLFSKEMNRLDLPGELRRDHFKTHIWKDDWKYVTKHNSSRDIFNSEHWPNESDKK